MTITYDKRLFDATLSGTFEVGEYYWYLNVFEITLGADSSSGRSYLVNHIVLNQASCLSSIKIRIKQKTCDITEGLWKTGIPLSKDNVIHIGFRESLLCTGHR